MAGGDSGDFREKVLLILGCVICAVWVIAVLVQVAFPKHVVPTEVHGVMLVLIPLLFGGAALQARASKNGNGGAKE